MPSSAAGTMRWRATYTRREAVAKGSPVSGSSPSVARRWNSVTERSRTSVIACSVRSRLVRWAETPAMRTPNAVSTSTAPSTRARTLSRHRRPGESTPRVSVLTGRCVARTRGGSEDPALERDGHRARAVVDPELGEDAQQVRLDGRLGDEQLGTHLSVRQTARDRPEHLDLARREALTPVAKHH